MPSASSAFTATQTPGPIAMKVVAAIKRTQRRKIVSIAEARQAADEAARIAQGNSGPEALRSALTLRGQRADGGDCDNMPGLTTLRSG